MCVCVGVFMMKCRHQQLACDCLQSLSISKSLMPIVVDLLLECVADVAERLRTAAADDDDDDSDGAASLLENAGHVLDCLEHVLAADTGGGAGRLELRRRLASQLDLSLKHIAAAFPLFAFRVWQVGGQLDGQDRRQLSDVNEASTSDRANDNHAC